MQLVNYTIKYQPRGAPRKISCLVDNHYNVFGTKYG